MLKKLLISLLKFFSAAEFISYIYIFFYSRMSFEFQLAFRGKCFDSFIKYIIRNLCKLFAWAEQKDERDKIYSAEGSV